ncbi:unnamed protein product [Adineta steineri]|uniref:Carrier domain-containing protein n=1 Tax=Adineta steineri TaxID=433720 RepID=A0A814QM24_9BILA|nr:unnamed protein product [Adineta steineri]CAF1122148.1 unnamed protein product [Adineta steineri]
MLSRKRLATGTNAHKEPKLTISGRTEAVASFVQQRIWLHEQLYFHSSDLSVYNILAPLIIKQGSLSIERVHSILLTLIEQHSVLRTAVRFNSQSNQIEQYIQAATDEIYSFQHSRGICTSEQLDRLLTNESTGKHFDIESGRVVRCHIVQRSNDEHDHRLSEGDLVAITFHHISFDNSSLKPFIEAFRKACLTDHHQQPVSSSPQYIDFTLYEQSMLADTRMDSKMNKARQFWSSLMDGYDWSQIRQLVPGEANTKQIRSGRGFSTTFSISQHIVDVMMLCASSNNSSMFELSLACYYAFLFKLINDDDLCVAGNIANRFVQDTKDMIGMFVNLAPYRMKIEPNKPFDHLVRKVQQLSSNILEYGCLPYQHIIKSYDQQGHQVLPSTLFHYESLMSSITQNNKLEITTDEGTVLGIYFDRDRSHGNGTALFDLSLAIAHDHHSRSTECFLDCSADIFQNQADVDLLANRFRHMLTQLFCSSMTDEPVHNQFNIPTSKLSLILPEEIEEMQRVTFRRLPTIINEAPASFAQARIWLDERIRFDPEKPQVAIYNMPFVHRLQSGHTLSVKQLHQALQFTIDKHLSLRTSLIFDTELNQLMQRVITRKDNYTDMFLIIETTYETDEQLNEILHDEKGYPRLFDLAQGVVFRCHLVYYKQISSNHLLSHKDLLIFNFHHALFDFPSMKVFHHDLNQAYATGQLLYDDNTNLRYLDYAAIEQQMSMTGANMFWLDALHDCKLDQPLSLPYDRYRLANEHRTGRGTSISFDFGQDLSHDFLLHASSNNISLEYLALTTYYVLLFKLTNSEKDLCIGINTHGRYRDEFRSIIGMFVNAIPLRCQLDRHLSFHKLTKHVRDIMIKCIKYSYFPLQRILNQYPNISNPVFLDTSFEFISSIRRDEEDEIMIGDSRFCLIPYSIKISEDEIMSKFDFILSFQHDLNLNEISCTINASVDLFNAETIRIIAQRLQTMLHQQFTSFNSKTDKPIYELSLTLSNEQYLMQSLNNTQVSFSSPLTCVHHEFIYQAMKYPQKLAVELDEQSLTYAELLYYSQCISLYLLYHYDVKSGDIVCQCVERSLAMVIGILSIAMVGGVYCPLSPQDPPQRLQTLLNQTHSRLVMIHFFTNSISEINVVRMNIDTAITVTDIYVDINLHKLSKVSVTPENIVFTIFTSGSTGIPKAVQLRHRNFTEFIHSFVHAGVLSKCDTIIQMARCSFDNHLLSLIGTLMTGGTLVMLRPNGNMDLEYLAEVLNQKQVTVMHCVPSLLNSLFTFLKENKHRSAVKCLRSLCSGGETLNMKVVSLLKSLITSKCQIRNHYGPAEITINCAYHLIDLDKEQMNIPIGRPLPNYRCLIVDKFSQNVYVGHEGELLVGGVGVFVGYFERDDLAAKVLININEQIFYKTGDLVQMNDSGSIHYVGRKDHQIKLHGQRIELREIEQCLLNITSISACIVMKYNEDYLVAYVQSSDVNEQELREHCQSHLPPHMVPSIFIILEKLPLNPNGKIDRKLLLPPNLSSLNISSSNEPNVSQNELEGCIHDTWCQVLRSIEKQISTTASFFSIGGHSLLFIEIYHRYQSLFDFDTRELTIGLFLQQPTIVQHSQLLQPATINHTKSTKWYALHINQGIASFAQERIFLDEQVRFSRKIAIYNELSILQVIQGSILVHRLLQALRYVLNKHKILQTSLNFNSDDSTLQQQITDMHQKFTLATDQTFHNENDLQNIIHQITINPTLFDLSIGRVFHCQILRQQIMSNETNKNEHITNSDILILAFHHVATDRSSRQFLFNDLCYAYNNNTKWAEDEVSLQYIDYAVHERLIDMMLSREFWRLQFEGCNFEHRLSLPIDQQCLSNEQRSGFASTVHITFDREISSSFLNYASLHHVTPFQLGLATFYTFLFKLIYSQTDLCISCVNANRYRPELQNMMGMFVSTLPYRAQLDPRWSFDDLVKYVQEKCLLILEHSHYPLQHILRDFHLDQSTAPFLQTAFDFITESSVNDQFTFGDVSLQSVSLKQSSEVAKFDFTLRFIYNPMSDDNMLSCRFICSRDLFEDTTVTKMIQRFKYLFEQLFSMNFNVNQTDLVTAPIAKLTLILPDEMNEIQHVAFYRQSNVTNEASSSLTLLLDSFFLMVNSVSLNTN